MSSVLVVIVLLGMWAFVLVPLVRQRSVRTDEIRSVARFSSALRVLSRGHSFSERSAFGFGQWVMPPREGLAVVRQRRLSAAASRTPGSVRSGAAGAGSGPAAARRRRLMTALAAAVTFTLLLVLVAGRLFIVLQVLADIAFAAGIMACRTSVAQEQAAAARSRRRRDTRELRSSLDAVTDRGRAWAAAAEPMSEWSPSADSDEALLMTVPLHAPVPTMTVPLDAPAQPRRAAPTVPAEARRTAEVPLAWVAAPAAARAAAPAAERAAAQVSRPAAPAARPAARPVPPRPRAEPVILAEIDLDWEPAVPEPSSCVRLVDIGAKARRTRLFEDSPADGVDVGDDSELDALVQRRLAASGW